MADNLWGPSEDEATFAASPPREDRPIDADALLAMHAAARDAGRSLEALLALARHAGKRGDAADLTAYLADHAPPLDEDAAFDVARGFVMMSNHSLFGHYPQRARDALPPSAMTALLRGAEPVRVLRQLAILCDQYGLPSIAADLIDAVVALRPGWTQPLFNRALIKMSLGDFFAARGDIKAMREAGEDGWEMLGQYFHHLAGEWTFVTIEPHDGDPDLRDVLARPLADAVVARWDELAAHLSGLRARLAALAEARGVIASFLPPEVDASPAEVNPEAGIPDLLLDARRTWVALCALAWTCGGEGRPTGAADRERSDQLHGWAEAMLAGARACADGEDPGVALVWDRQPLARFDPQFTGITLVALFEGVAELAAWLVGAEPPMNDADDEDD